MNASRNFARIDELGQRLADQAFRALISLCPEIRSASSARQEAVCALCRCRHKQHYAEAQIMPMSIGNPASCMAITTTESA